MRNSILLTVLAMSLLIQIPIANARDHHGHGDAFAAGLIGLGIGMAITAPRVYSRSYWDDDHEYHRHPYHYRPYWRNHYPRHHRRPYADEVWIDSHRRDWND